MVQVYLKISSMQKRHYSPDSKIFSLIRGIARIATLMGIVGVSSLSWSQESEFERLDGFKTQKKENAILDREREKGYAAYLESLEKEAFEKKQALEDYKKAKKLVKPSEDTAYYKQYLMEQSKREKEYDENLKEYLREKKKWSFKNFKRPFSEEFELDIFLHRPRYDYKKRAMYGAKPKYKISPGASSSGGGSYVPPDLGRDSGFIPPPPPPMEPMEPFIDDMPPPPPPMPMDGMGDFNNDGFIPPPPPPPPMFDGEF